VWKFVGVWKANLLMGIVDPEWGEQNMGIHNNISARAPSWKSASIMPCRNEGRGPLRGPFHFQYWKQRRWLNGNRNPPTASHSTRIYTRSLKIPFSRIVPRVRQRCPLLYLADVQYTTLQSLGKAPTFCHPISRTTCF